MEEMKVKQLQICCARIE